MRLLVVLFSLLFISCGGGDLCISEKNENYKLKKDVELWQGISEDYRRSYEDKNCSYSELP